MGIILDIYENLRKTKPSDKSNAKKTKPEPRHYDFNAGFTGNKKEDYAAGSDIIKTNNKPRKQEEHGDRDDR